jgi:hypothetical protein
MCREICKKIAGITFCVERDGMNRRKFLKVTEIVIGTIALGTSGVIITNEINKDPLNTIKGILFRKINSKFGEKNGNKIALQIDHEYQITQSQLPNIGLIEENKWAVYMPPTSLALAAYRVLVPKEVDINQFGKLFFESVQEQMENISSYLMRIVGTDQGMKEKTRILADRSQQRKYKEDWVIHFVEGNGGDYIYGIDVTECAILKYLSKQGAPELTRYLCLTDYITSEAIGRGLVRNKTLAEGCDCCDFRYKQGRSSYLKPLRNGWPPMFVDTID